MNRLEELIELYNEKSKYMPRTIRRTWKHKIDKLYKYQTIKNNEIN